MIWRFTNGKLFGVPIVIFISGNALQSKALECVIVSQQLNIFFCFSIQETGENTECLQLQRKQQLWTQDV